MPIVPNANFPHASCPTCQLSACQLSACRYSPHANCPSTHKYACKSMKVLFVIFKLNLSKYVLEFSFQIYQLIK